MNDYNENDIGISEVSGLGFLIKLKRFFSKLFSSTDEVKLLGEGEIFLDNKEMQFTQKFGDIDVYKTQELYEENKIQESEIPTKRVNELKDLYVEQITDLDKNF